MERREELVKKVLITGAGGFIGKKIVQVALTKSEWEIHVTVSGNHKHSFPDEVKIHKVDLSNPEDCETLIKETLPDIIVHLAWGLDTASYEGSETNLIWIENSLRLLRLFFNHGGKRFVFCGSGSEYGQPGGRFTEEPIAITRTVYGASKISFEQIAKVFCGINQLEFVSARCFSVYGDHDTRRYRGIVAAIEAFHRGDQFICKAPNNVWDFIHVEDVANAMVQITDSSYCGIVNVGSGKPHLMRDVFVSIAEKMSCKELLFFEDSQKDITILVADTTVLNDIIGYKCSVDFSDGLDRTIAWWKSQI